MTSYALHNFNAQHGGKEPPNAKQKCIKIVKYHGQLQVKAVIDVYITKFNWEG